MWATGDRVKALQTARLEQSPASVTVASAMNSLTRFPGDRQRAQEVASQAALDQLTEMGRHLRILESIAQVAPMMGLLGTVIGMIEIFASQQSGSSPQQLAHGISIALYCTAFGIIVAVPSVLAYRHFKSKVESFVVSMEDQSQQLLEAIFTERYDLEPR
jgi:biopolymer transport protein ExbB